MRVSEEELLEIKARMKKPKKIKEIIPTEHDEAVTFVQMMKILNIPTWHIPNETYTTSWNQKRKNKQEGVTKGIADYFCVIPKEKSKEGSTIGIFIELKRIKKSKVAPEQIQFIDMVECIDGIHSEICYGAKEAINFINQYLK